MCSSLTAHYLDLVEKARLLCCSFFFSCVFLEFLNFLCQKRLKKFFGQMVSFKYLLRYTEKAFPSTGEPWTSVPIPQILEGDKV